MKIDHTKIDPQREIKFSYNWNNKLNNKMFTTIRLDKAYYAPGYYYKVFDHKGEYLFKAQIKEKRIFLLDDLPSMTAALDTGYSLQETKSILQTMYAAKDIDFSTTNFCILLLENIQYEERT